MSWVDTCVASPHDLPRPAGIRFLTSQAADRRRPVAPRRANLMADSMVLGSQGLEI